MGGEGNGGDLIQVKLEVLDGSDSVVDHWLLPVENVTNEISRQPVIFCIPMGSFITGGASSPALVPGPDGGGGDGGGYLNNRPFAYALDFSMMNEMLNMDGVSPDNNVDKTQPSAHQLREIARTHWFGAIPTVPKDGIPTVHGGIRLTINEGAGQGTHAYQGLILNLSTNRVGGQEYWTWKMTMQVTKWPLGMKP